MKRIVAKRIRKGTSDANTGDGVKISNHAPNAPPMTLVEPSRNSIVELFSSSTILFRLGVTGHARALGAWLLIWTPSPASFPHSFPFLILFATILTAAEGDQQATAARIARTKTDGTLVDFHSHHLPVFSAMYGGYFGAGNGGLAVLGPARSQRSQSQTGNFLRICIDSIAVVSFGLAGLVVGKMRS